MPASGLTGLVRVNLVRRLRPLGASRSVIRRLEVRNQKIGADKGLFTNEGVAG